MSNQPENEIQQSSILEEVRQSLQAELNASKQAIADLNDEELEAIAGGVKSGDALSGVQATYKLARKGGNNLFSSAIIAIKSGPKFGVSLGKKGFQDSQAMYDHGAQIWDKSPK